MDQLLREGGGPSLLPIQKGAATDPRQLQLNQASEEIKALFPGLRLPNLIVEQGVGRGGAEAFPPDELHNPNPFSNTIQIRSQDTEDRLQDLITTEKIQLFSKIDPQMKEFKQRFRQSLTLDQIERSRRRFEPREGFGDKRSFDEFMDQVDLDASIRAIMFPHLVTDPGFDPSKAFTPEQFSIVDDIITRLKQ